MNVALGRQVVELVRLDLVQDGDLQHTQLISDTVMCRHTIRLTQGCANQIVDVRDIAVVREERKLDSGVN